MTDFSDEQQAALNTLTVAYPGGITLTADRVHDIEVCDQLVEMGYAVRIESDDFPGVGYQLSPEYAAANQVVVEQRAAEAEQN